MDAKILFANGNQMPVIGLGTWDTTDPKQLQVVIDTALGEGYRSIDTAYVYLNEEIIGNVLKNQLDSDKIKRQELFITTKLPIIGMTPERASYFVKKSLERLKLDYIDLYLIHLPIGLHYVDDNTMFPMKDGKSDIDPSTNLVEVWKALETHVDKGEIKSLGVSNMNIDQLNRIYNNAKHKPMNIQVEMHVYFQQRVLREECKRLGITVCAYAPFGSPARNPAFRPTEVKWELNGILENPTVAKIAVEKGKSKAQVLLRFLIQLGVVVIPKSGKPERIKENFQIFDFELTADEMKVMEELDKGEDGRTFRFDTLPGLTEHPEYPFKT